jgi:hypothetical protein
METEQARWAAQLREVPLTFRRALSTDERILRHRPAPLEWSAIEVPGHMIDKMTWWSLRVQRIWQEDRPVLPGYDQDAVVREQGYQQADPAVLLDALLQECERFAALVAALPASILDREGVHEECGVMTLRHCIQAPLSSLMLVSASRQSVSRSQPLWSGASKLSKPLQPETPDHHISSSWHHQWWQRRLIEGIGAYQPARTPHRRIWPLLLRWHRHQHHHQVMHSRLPGCRIDLLASGLHASRWIALRAPQPESDIHPGEALLSDHAEGDQARQFVHRCLTDIVLLHLLKEGRIDAAPILEQKPRLGGRSEQKRRRPEGAGGMICCPCRAIVQGHLPVGKGGCGPQGVDRIGERETGGCPAWRK